MAIDELESLVLQEYDLIFQTAQSYLAKSSISNRYKDEIWKALTRLSPERNTVSRNNLTLLLPRLSYQACGGIADFPPKVSAAWYLFYIAADLMDSVQDREQRFDLENTPYSFSEWLNLASSFFFIANGLLVELLDQQYDQERVRSVLQAFQAKLLEMCEGQQLDLSARDISLVDYLDILRKKSGAFFSLACIAGARLAGNEPSCLDDLAGFGLHVGCILQILDDLEDWHRLENGETQILSTTEWIKNLATIYTLEVLPSEEKTLFRQIIEKVINQPDEWQTYVAWVNRSGAALYILTLLIQEVESAKKHLQNSFLNPGPKEILDRVLNNLVGEI